MDFKKYISNLYKIWDREKDPNARNYLEDFVDIAEEWDNAFNSRALSKMIFCTVVMGELCHDMRVNTHLEGWDLICGKGLNELLRDAASSL